MNEAVDLDTDNFFQLNEHCFVVVENNIAILSRAFESQVPLFYAISQSKLWYSENYSSLVKTLLNANVELSVNRDYVYDQLKFQAPLTANTLFRPIRFLRVGEKHHVDIVGGNIQQNSFSPENNSVPLSSLSFSQILRDELSGIDKNTTVFHLSSGLDSSLLAIIASQINGKGIKVASCKTRGNGASNELAIVDRLATDIHAELEVYDLTSIDLLKVGSRQIKYQGYPVAHPSNLLEYALDSEIVAQGATTIFNGKGPDDCLAGYTAHQNRFSVKDRHRERLTVTEETVLAQLFGNEYGDATQFWSLPSNTISLSERMYYDARALTDSWNHIHNSVANGLQCTIKSPFMTPSIRNGLFALDDNQRLAKGKQKAFLRETFSEIYPNYILNQPKAAFTLDLRPYFLDFSSFTLREYLFDDLSTLEPFISKKAIDDMIECTLSGKRNLGWQLWSLFLCHLAIKEFGVSSIS